MTLKSAAHCFLPIVLASIMLGCQAPEATSSSSTPSAPTSGALPAVDTSRSTIPFTTLAQGDTPIAGLEQPALLVIGEATEVDQLLPMVDNPAIAEQLKAVDVATTYVVAAFSGPVGSGGYSIAIQTVGQASGAVDIGVQVTPPPADRAVTDVISYPYHIVTVARQNLVVSPGTTWSMHGAESTPMAQVQYP